MAILNYIIWNGSPEIVSIGPITLRWYGLLFALGFLISQQLLYYIYKKEGKPEKDVDTLTIYMVVATIIGARLGHVIFYEPTMFIEDPWKVFMPIEFTPKFSFTGLQGLASHGGAIGILLALWWYARKKKPGQNYLQVLDRIVILVALTGALIRLGNYFNSEIIGKPTNSDYGIAFVSDLTESLKRDEFIEAVHYVKVDTATSKEGYKLVRILLDFKKEGYNYTQFNSYLHGSLTNRLYSYPEHFTPAQNADSKLLQDENGQYSAIVNTYVIPRHPAQLYESISCFLLFILLFWLWKKYGSNPPEGRLFGIFLIVCFGLRFAYEFLKEPQVEFEETLPINMGQILSIPLVIVGIFILWRSYKKNTPASQPGT